MSVTLIAKKAGVSIATVSRVLNKSRPVNPEIAERVLQAVSDLQLPPQRIRRRAKSVAKPLTVAIVSLGSHRNWFEIPVMSNMIANLTHAAQTRHVGVLIAEMPDPMEISPALRRQDVEGALVFVDRHLAAKDMDPLRRHLPIVRVMGGHLSPSQVDHVTTDNCAIGYLAANYFIDKSIRELAYLTTTPSWEISQLRAHGFLAATRAAGIAPGVYLQGETQATPYPYGPDVTVEQDLKVLVNRMLAARKGQLGLFVTRDQDTVAVYQQLREANVEIGRDVVVISCDNEAVRLSTLYPRPVSIDLSASHIANVALELLIKRIQDPRIPCTRTLVSPQLQPDE